VPAALDLSHVGDLSVWNGADPEHIASETRTILGRTATPEEIVSWAGVDQTDLGLGAAVSLFPHNDDLHLEIQTARFTLKRQYRRRDYGEHAGKLIAHHDYFALRSGVEKGEGIGARLFGRQVRALRAAGFDLIDAFAAGRWKDPSFNGYYTWPRFGYNAAIPADMTLPANLKGATTLHDLMMTSDGREFWKRNGSWIDVEFDLTPGSRSLQIHEAYLIERGARLDARDVQDGRGRPQKAGRPQEEIELSAEDETALDRAWARIAHDGWTP